eukprot:364199-Chlamydomonas_euryale.AAC.13
MPGCVRAARHHRCGSTCTSTSSCAASSWSATGEESPALDLSIGCRAARPPESGTSGTDALRTTSSSWHCQSTAGHGGGPARSRHEVEASCQLRKVRGDLHAAIGRRRIPRVATARGAGDDGHHSLGPPSQVPRPHDSQQPGQPPPHPTAAGGGRKGLQGHLTGAISPEDPAYPGYALPSLRCAGTAIRSTGDKQAHRPAALISAHNGYLRRITGMIRRPDGILYPTAQLCATAGVPQFLQLLNAARLTRLGHVARMPDTSTVKQLFFAEGLVGRSGVAGRPRSTWRVRALAALRPVQTARLAGLGWFGVAQDRSEWKALCNTAVSVA